MQLTEQIVEAFWEFRRLSNRYEIAASSGLAAAWESKRKEQSQHIDTLLSDPKAPEACMWLKLAGRLEPLDLLLIQTYYLPN